MAELTITVDDATLRRAGVQAAQRGESVNADLAAMLRSYADAADQAAVFAELADIAKGHPRTRSPGPRWTRDELHSDS